MTVVLISLLIGITLILVLQFWFGFSARPIVRALIQSQAVFWFLAFILRPLYLVVNQPTSPIYLGDTRLVSLGYSEVLTPVLVIIAVGQLAFLLTLILLRKKIINPKLPTEAVKDRFSGEAVSTAFFVWIAGLSLYLAGSTISSSSSPIFFLAACSGAGILLVFYERQTSFKSALVLPVVFVSCVVLGVVSASKAPVLAALLAVFMRTLLSNSSKLSFRKIVAYVAGSLGTFLVIQPIKGINTFFLVSEGSTDIGKLVSSTQISILERFDGAIAVVDAYVAGQGSWLSPVQYINRMLTMSLPRSLFGLGTDSPGQLWALEVRAQSNPIQRGVSLAVGPSADGYIVLGWVGVILFNVLLASFLVYACANFESLSPLKVVFFSVWIFGPQFFEQSLLNVASGFSRGIIICLACWLWLILRRSWSHKL